MNVYNHIVFNPKMENLTKVVNIFGNSIWALSHVVPVHEYEWVAVFEAWDSEGNDQEVLGKTPIEENLTPPPCK